MTSRSHRVFSLARPIRLLALALAVSSLMLAAPSTHAAKKSKKSTNAAHVTVKKHGTRVKPSQNNSGETTAERERRLYRECRGMPNAGACLGYTRP
ncbi:MAG: hypothetical protein WA917_02640 [Comamonas sp.]|nr:hypothetical protein [Comamonas sp.]